MHSTAAAITSTHTMATLAVAPRTGRPKSPSKTVDSCHSRTPVASPARARVHISHKI